MPVGTAASRREMVDAIALVDAVLDEIFTSNVLVLLVNVLMLSSSVLSVAPRFAVTVAGRVDTGNGLVVEAATRVDTADFHSITMPVGAVEVSPSTYSVFAFSDPETTSTGSGKLLATGRRVDTADFHRKTVPVGSVVVFASTYCVPPPIPTSSAAIVILKVLLESGCARIVFVLLVNVLMLLKRSVWVERSALVDAVFEDT